MKPSTNLRRQLLADLGLDTEAYQTLIANDAQFSTAIAAFWDGTASLDETVVAGFSALNRRDEAARVNSTAGFHVGRVSGLNRCQIESKLTSSEKELANLQKQKHAPRALPRLEKEVADLRSDLAELTANSN
jgi:hypothetical protein